MTIENLSTLKIHKLSQAQYERESAAGRIDENALYLVPDTDTTKELSPEDILNLFIELNLINPLTDEKGFILTENDNTLLVF